LQSATITTQQKIHNRDIRKIVSDFNPPVKEPWFQEFFCMELFDAVHIELQLGRVQQQLHFEDPVRVQGLIDTALRLVDPKAGYSLAYPESQRERSVMIAGTEFQSGVLSKNLAGVGRVFPFVITLGPALEGEAAGLDDLLDRYLLDTIGDLILRQTSRQLQEHLQTRYKIPKLSSMSPGSLPDWPIYEQEKLFALLGEAPERLGVLLNESLLMIPRKSISGFYFPTEISFFSCQLCPRKHCESRKAAFDAAKAAEYGMAETG
jgi:hypothetical protein